MTAANPVVPASAVEKAAEASYHASFWFDGENENEHPADWDSIPEVMQDGVRRKVRAALTAALPDLIAANTGDTKAEQFPLPRQPCPIHKPAPCDPACPYSPESYMARAAALRTDTTHKDAD